MPRRGSISKPRVATTWGYHCPKPCFSTPKALYLKAQGRAAHPGYCRHQHRISTPKALYLKAQGRAAHPGRLSRQQSGQIVDVLSEGVGSNSVVADYTTPSALKMGGAVMPQGALRDPGLCYTTPSALKNWGAVIPQGALRDPGLCYITPSALKYVGAYIFARSIAPNS